MVYLYIYNNGCNYPDFACYPQNCTVKCTSFALKTMRSFACSLMRTMYQTIYQTMCVAMYQTMCEPIAIFARDSARDLTHFRKTEND